PIFTHRTHPPPTISSSTETTPLETLPLFPSSRLSPPNLATKCLTPRKQRRRKTTVVPTTSTSRSSGAITTRCSSRSNAPLSLRSSWKRTAIAKGNPQTLSDSSTTVSEFNPQTPPTSWRWKTAIPST
ncbi:hypothetical protein BC938DRAFT_481396, partial [Jimgerdemannia flammicorona]